MRTFLILLVALAVLVGASYASSTPQFGIAVKLPLAVSVQLTLPIGLAIEARLTPVGPAVFVAKLYLPQLEPADLEIVPVIGVGGAVAFLPGDIVATGFYALAGLEIPIPETPLSLTGDMDVLVPWPIEAGTTNFGGKVGLRFDF